MFFDPGDLIREGTLRMDHKVVGLRNVSIQGSMIHHLNGHLEIHDLAIDQLAHEQWLVERITCATLVELLGL